MDLIAGALELIGLWVIGDKSAIGFIISMCGSACWIYVGVRKKVYGLLLVCIPALFINMSTLYVFSLIKPISF